ncbi:MAG TPA: TonB-dependent receptor [Sphingomonadales bacterium]|nr:TonB-dependent receptor [Sphingomonadales bacterium]
MSASRPRLSRVRQHMVIWTICGGVLTPLLPTNSYALDPSRLVQSQSRSVSFTIESLPLRAALLEFSKQSGIQLIYVAQKEPLQNVPALKGKYTIRQALRRLLRATGFEYEFSEENTVTIRTKGDHTDKIPQNKNDISSPQTTTEADNNPAAGLEEIISIGSRAKGRTAVKTPVPVDTISARSMMATGETETGRILQSLAPSFNFSSSSISDGTDAVKPATLRGLGPDQTLVLINGKRRHTSALVHVNTSVGRGATGVDMNAIPPSAIKRIEVLRDGASAQYGSDAIAGVINIILKDQSDGGNISSSYGQTYKGDGDTFVANGSYGIKLMSRGHLTLSAEFRDKKNTNRAGLTGCLQFETGGQKPCAEGNIAIDPREASFERKNFRIGDSDSRQKALVMNMALPFDDNSEFYMFGTYSDRDNQSAGFYRRANDVRRTVVELYPEGFLPLINSRILDHSILAGVMWDMGRGWTLDASATTGGNSFQFIIANSLNASFGADSPTSANAGTLKINQTTVNIDLSKAYEKANIAFGAEWRHEDYRIIAGEPVSYQNGGQFNRNCPGCDINPIPYAPGFQVFRGFSPDNAVDEGRNNLAIYTDVEIEILNNFLLNVAARFEDYSDFGSRINAKFAARYQISSAFALRGSISSGFRAPSMQQKFFNSTSTQFVEVNGQSVAQERGTFRNDSTVARTLGIPELKKETAINYSLGFVATLADNLTMTADYYRIDINDRIAISGSIPIGDDFPLVTAATGATDGQFFTNMADTKTQGVDFVLNYNVPMKSGHRLMLSLAANKTETRIKSGSIASPLPGVDGLVLFSPQDRSIIEEWQPSSRINFTLDYGYKQWSFVLRNNFYGSYVVCEGSCNTTTGPGQNIQKFGSKMLTDLQLSYFLDKARVRLILGANNLFNIFPDMNKIGQSRAGSIDGIVSSPGVFTYSRRSAPFGHNGGYYYMRVVKSF